MIDLQILWYQSDLCNKKKQVFSSHTHTQQLHARESKQSGREMKKRRKIDSFQFSHRIDDVTINNSKHSTFLFVSVFVLNAIRQCCRLLFACDWEKFLYLRSVNISTFIVFDESRRRIRRGHHHYEIIQLLSMRIELSIRKLIKTLQQQLNTRIISLCFGHFLRNKIYLASFFVTLLTSFHCSIHFKKRL